MGQSFIEMIFIDGDNACQTGMRTASDTDAATWAAFRSYRQYGVDIKTASFLLDYRNRKGDLCDTIALDGAGFKAVTGQAPKKAAAYRKIDRDYWNAARAERKRAA